MNKRIRELAEQAGYYLYDLTETHQMKTVETDEKDEWITLEKFAELIVRESIVDFYRRYLDLESEEDITEQVNRYVKDNFGGVS